MSNCFLVLEDGEVFKGVPFGAPAPRADEFLGGGAAGGGEVVFNTAMSGYHEMLTDPSYAGQIVVLTSPHAGNYGCDDAWSERGPDDPGMAEIKLRGLVVRSCFSGPVPRGRISLDAFLKKHGIPGLADVDTRSLTIRLREKGSCNSFIVAPSAGDALSVEDIRSVASSFRRLPSMEGANLLASVGTRTALPASFGNHPRFTVVDCGVKGNILRELGARGSAVTVLPWTASSEDILSTTPDGVLFSNGPGDPAALASVVTTIRNLIGVVPVFGICLGHQMIALALGGRTRKMKFGHHGCNHPVRDERTGKVQVTSQNHGFEVDEQSLPPDVTVWFRNANDGSVEGLMHGRLPVMSCQFHPEAAPGPRDSSWIFDEFVGIVSRRKEGSSCLLETI